MLAETAAQSAKYNAQELKLQEQLDEQTQKMANETALGGLKGAPLIQAQLQAELDAINAAERKAVGPGGTETAAQSVDYNTQRVLAAQGADQKMTQSHQQFVERISELDDRADSTMQQG